MYRKLHASFALLAILSQGPLVYAQTYAVKKGDTLSHIAAREFGRPIYGPKGSLQKLLQKNPDIQNPNRIDPDQLIRLSDDPSAEQVALGSQPAKAPTPADTSAAEAMTAEPNKDASQAAGSGRNWGVRLGLEMSKDELEAVDHGRSFKTNLDSELQPKIDLDAYYKPSEASRVGLSLGIKNGNFEDSNDGRFEGESSALYRFSIFGELTLAERGHLGLELGSEQSFFLMQSTAVSFGLEEVFVDFATVSAGYDIVVHEGWRWGLQAQGSFHAPADADGNDVRKGSSYSAASRLAYSWNSGYSVEGTLQYGRRSQGIDGIRQKMTERAAGIAVRYEF